MRVTLQIKEGDVYYIYTGGDVVRMVAEEVEKENIYGEGGGTFFKKISGPTITGYDGTHPEKGEVFIRGGYAQFDLESCTGVEYDDVSEEDWVFKHEIDE